MSEGTDNIENDKHEEQILISLDKETIGKTQYKKSLLKNKDQRLKFRAKIKEKRAELNKKTTLLLEDNFAKVWDKKVLIHTAIFILGAILIGISPTFTNNGQLWTISVSLVMISGYFLLYQFSKIKKIHDLLFAEKKWGIKLLFTFIAFGIGGLLVYLYLVVINPLIPTVFPYLEYQKLFAFLLAVVYFGWNIIQIIFIKSSLENASIAVEARSMVKNENKQLQEKIRKTKIINLVLILLPLLIHLVISFLIIYIDTLPQQQRFLTDEFTWSAYLTAHPGTDFASYLDAIWFKNDALIAIVIWTISVIIIQIITLRKELNLTKQSHINESPNIFNGMFYFLFWIIIYLRLFILIYVYIGTLSNVSLPTDNGTFIFKIFDWVTGILLMVLTIVNMIRGVGKRLRDLNNSKLTLYNLTFLTFILVISYWGAQMSLIIDANSQETLTLGTTIILVVVNIGYYLWYSQQVSEKRGFIRRTNYNTLETKDLLIRLSRNIQKNLFQTVENKKIVTETLNNYLLEEKIVLKTGKKEDTLIKSLDVEEKVLNFEEKVERAKKELEISKTDKIRYEEAKDALDKHKQRLKTIQDELTKINSRKGLNLGKLKEEIDANKHNLEVKSKQKQEFAEKLAILEKDLKKIKIPKPLTAKKEGDEEKVQQRENEIQEAHSKKTAKEELIENTKKNMSNIDQEIEKIEENIHNLTEEVKLFEEDHVSRENLVREREEMSDFINDIESNMVILKERADESIPVIQKAETVLKSATQEYKLSTELNSAKIKEEELSKLQLKKEQSVKAKLEHVQGLQGQIETMIPLEKAEKNITEAENRLRENSTKYEESEITFGKKSEQFKIKQNTLAQIQSEVETAEGTLRMKEGDLSRKRDALIKAQAELKKGREHMALLAEAEKKVEMAIEKQNSFISLSDASAHEAEISNQLKMKKQELKKQQKDDPKDGTMEAIIESLKDDINNLEQNLSSASEQVKTAKLLKAKTESAEKTRKKLEKDKVDISALSQNVSKIEEEIPKLELDLHEPKNILEIKRKELIDATEQLNIAKLDKESAINTRNKLKNIIESAQATIKQNKTAIEAKKIKEEELSQAEKELKSIKLELAETNKKLDGAINARKTLDQQLINQIDLARADWVVYRAQKDLKEAHGTLKDAIRSAESNVKACESNLKQAVAERDRLSNRG